MAKKDKKVEIAVALKYEKDKDTAPKIIASGKGEIANQIINLAKEKNIHTHQDAELAQILSALDVDSIIPIEAYIAVAEILSYIYKINSVAKKNL